MPDYKKWTQIKSMMDSLGSLMADYEEGFGEAERGAKDPENYGHEDKDDGGQESMADMEPEMDTKNPNSSSNSSKKGKMSMMAKMIKKSMSGY